MPPIATEAHAGIITVAHNRLQENGRLRGLLAVIVIIGVAPTFSKKASPSTPPTY
jgi:hypothetical protein